jgi:hypothetical protein
MEKQGQDEKAARGQIEGRRRRKRWGRRAP